MMSTIKLRLVAAACFLVVPLLSAGAATAADRTKGYMMDGAQGIAPYYANPADGFCVSGLKADGTMTVVPGITNFRDCVAYTAGLIGMTAADVTATSTCGAGGTSACNTSANCSKVDGSLTWVAALQKCFNTASCTIAGAGGNDGAKHTYSASLCINPSTRDGISRVDLDNNAVNCQEKGGVLSDGLFGHPYGACSAYGWIYGGVRADGTRPDVSGGKGVLAADNLGVCYASMRMTTAAGYNTAAGCPSIHNDSTVANPNLATEWPFGTDSVRYQTVASYDAGLGWSFSGGQCLYQYGVKGYLNADLRGANGLIPTLTKCDATSGSATAGTCVDLSGLATQGDCLSKGGSWDNWLPAYAAFTTVVPTTLASTIVKLDAHTSTIDGGGHFYSNTGNVCLKCHSDQSRAYMERYKPGFIETPHKLAGDTPPFTNVGSEWETKGVQCTICHATGKPARQDVGVIVYPNTTGTNAGLPRAATGHNQTEYGSHVTGVCYYCHGTATANPAANIPVTSGDFSLTSKNLAPIANQFLNSPHAKYDSAAGNRTVDVITKTNYSSSFNGYVCRTGAEVTDAATAANGVDVTATSTCGGTGALTCNSAANCPATPGGNRVWNPITSKCYDKGVCTGAAAKTWDFGTNRCVETAATCATQSDSGYGFFWKTTPVAGILSLVTSSGAGCYKAFAGGSIATTYWDAASGTAKKVENLDTVANTGCTSTTAGAGGFWTSDGEAATTSNGVAVAASDQGSCMTCHDVHWKIGSTAPGAEPFRKECTSCHSHPAGEASLTSAPQIDLTKINHPGGPGTPLANASTVPTEACEMCHMPKSSAVGSRMHLWRINTSSGYTTLGPTQANTAAAGSYANAAWVDLDLACGQCHGGTSGVTKNGAPPLTKAALATYAQGIHMNKPVASFTGSASGLTFSVDASSSLCGGSVNNCDSFAWSWGDTGTSSKSQPIPNPWLNSHTYAAGGSYTVTLTVSYLGTTATASKLITLTDPNATTVGGVCTFVPNTWVASVTDTTSTVGSGKTVAKVVVSWGDGTPYGITTTFPMITPLTHTYLNPGTFTVNEQVIDSGGSSTTTTLPCTPAAAPAYFTVSGKVTQSNGATPVVSAVVKLMVGTTAVKSLFTDASGNYTATALKPGTYTIAVTKAGVTFGNPAPTAAVGGSKIGINVSSTVP